MIRISLFVAILAALAVGVLNIVVVKDKLNTLVTDRNTQRDGRTRAEGERDKAKTELATAKKDLAQSQQDLADAKTERDKGGGHCRCAGQSGPMNCPTNSPRLRRTLMPPRPSWPLTWPRAFRLKWSASSTNYSRTRPKRWKLPMRRNLVLDRERKRLQSRLSMYEGTNQVVTLRADLRGKILVVDPKWDFVVLNIGQDQGVIDNGELLVSREGKLVAKVIVRSIEKNRSIANIIPGWKLGEVIEGDEVTPAHPAS